jgi:hypothetical protein
MQRADVSKYTGLAQAAPSAPAVARPEAAARSTPGTNLGGVESTAAAAAAPPKPRPTPSFGP